MLIGNQLCISPLFWKFILFYLLTFRAGNDRVFFRNKLQLSYLVVKSFQYVNWLSLYCVPKGYWSISVTRHNFSPFGGPSDSSNLLFTHQCSIQFCQFLSAWFIKIENIKFTVIKWTCEQIISIVVQMKGSDCAFFIVIQDCYKFWFFGLG